MFKRYILGVLLILAIFLVSYLKESYIINLEGGDFLLSRSTNGFKWGTVGYDVTNLSNKVRFISGLIFVIAFFTLSVTLLWVLFRDNQFLLIFISIYIITALFSLIAFWFYRMFLWDGFFIAGTRLKELITSPMYILVATIIFYLSKRKLLGKEMH